MMNQVPTFSEMIIPAYEVLLEINCPADNETVLQEVVRKMDISDEAVQQPHANSTKSELWYRLGWTKTFMKKYGILSPDARRGEWLLSDSYSVRRDIDVDDVLRKVRTGITDPETVTSGYLYVLTNQAFPEYIKVGFAEDVDAAVNKLNDMHTTPFPFEVFCTYEVEANNADVIFRNLLSCISPSASDFFNIPAEEVFTILTMIAKLHGYEDRLVLKGESDDSDVDVVDIVAPVTRAGRKPPFRFSMVDMHEGDIISFVNDPGITAVVASDKKILYQGEITSLSWLAQVLLKKDNPVQGTLYFTYEGETLDARRERFEREADI